MRGAGETRPFLLPVVGWDLAAGRDCGIVGFGGWQLARLLCECVAMG